MSPVGEGHGLLEPTGKRVQHTVVRFSWERQVHQGWEGKERVEGLRAPQRQLSADEEGSV